MFRVKRGTRGAAPVFAVAAIFLLLAASSGVARGEKMAALRILKSKGCGACHFIPGIPEARGTIGPSLKGLKNRVTIARGRLENTPENLRDWLTNPKTILSDTMMPNLGLEQAELDAVIEFLRTL